MTAWALLATVVAAIVALVPAGLLGGQDGSETSVFLAQHAGFSDRDLRALSDGDVVLHSLETPVPQEILHVGAIALDVTPGHFLERFLDIERFERGPGTPQIGRFSTPPTYADIAALTLPAADIEALRDCRAGDCGVKLPAAMMEQFRRDVDWAAAAAAAQANHLMREMILALVRAYQADGNQALGTYDDGDQPLLVADEFSALLDSNVMLATLAPELLRHLRDYPAARPAGAAEFFYWTVVNFGLKDTIRVNHVTIYPVRGALPPVAYMIATKQVYASHYFHTTLELRLLLDEEPQAGGARTTLVSTTHARNDGMTGMKGFFLRPIITRRSRDGVAGYLEHVKRQVERPAQDDQ